MASFEELLAEGESVPVEGWDFSWFQGRATEQRPSWGYARLMGEADDLPFDDGSFDLVASRHPVTVRWDEVARVLAPDGTYFSQQVGAGSVQELIDFMLGTQPVGQVRAPERAGAAATAAGLTVLHLCAEALRTEFYDVAAVIVFLRKVIWTVRDFTIPAYYNRLQAMHAHITQQGTFIAHSQRFLIETHKPA